MKIKNYKLVHNSIHNDSSTLLQSAYSVYTDDLKPWMDDSDGYELGFVYERPIDLGFVRPGESCWGLVLRNIIGRTPYYCDNPNKPYKSKKKAVKNLVKYQNKLLREMKL